MPVSAAYIGVIIIWATTPLAIKWSGEQGGFLFGTSARMALGALICLVLLAVLRRPLPWHKAARLAYLSVALGFFGAVSCVHWGAQFIPSGLVSVISGITPLLTALLASYYLQENALTGGKVLGMLLSLIGLIVIFYQQIELQEQAWKGLLGILLAVALHSLSAVMVKRSNAQLGPLQLTSGGLLLSLPLFALAWLVSAQTFPAELPARTWAAIAYLGLFGSVVGFMMYYHLLHHIAVSKVALITLLTPVCALFIGQAFNGEHIGATLWFGTALVLSGLALHQWGDGLITSATEARRC